MCAESSAVFRLGRIFSGPNLPPPPENLGLTVTGQTYLSSALHIYAFHQRLLFHQS